MTTVVFDCDDTLIDNLDQPRWDVVETLRFFTTLPECQVFVHSGGGKDYAEMWGRRLFLPESVRYFDKYEGAERYDVSFDDETVNCGIINIKIKRADRL